MERAYRERAGQDVGWVKIDPMLDDLRGNPRFEARVQKFSCRRIPRSTHASLQDEPVQVSAELKRCNIYKVAIAYAVIAQPTTLRPVADNLCRSFKVSLIVV